MGDLLFNSGCDNGGNGGYGGSGGVMDYDQDFGAICVLVNLVLFLVNLYSLPWRFHLCALHSHQPWAGDFVHSLPLHLPSHAFPYDPWAVGAAQGEACRTHHDFVGSPCVREKGWHLTTSHSLPSMHNLTLSCLLTYIAQIVQPAHTCTHAR